MNQWIDWKQFVTDVTQKALEKEEETLEDNLNSIEGLKFNERAGAIFNMIQSVVGIDNFNEGVKSFVKTL